MHVEQSPMNLLRLLRWVWIGRGLALFARLVLMMTCLPAVAAEPAPAAGDQPIRALWLGVPHADVTPEILVERIKRHLDCEIVVRQDWQQALREPDFAAGFAAVIYSPCDPECRDMELVKRALATANSGVGTVLVHCAMHTRAHDHARWLPGARPQGSCRSPRFFQRSFCQLAHRRGRTLSPRCPSRGSCAAPEGL